MQFEPLLLYFIAQPTYIQKQLLLTHYNVFIKMKEYKLHLKPFKKTTVKLKKTTKKKKKTINCLIVFFCCFSCFFMFSCF